jgi:hypothetical protein
LLRSSWICAHELCTTAGTTARAGCGFAPAWVRGVSLRCAGWCCRDGPCRRSPGVRGRRAPCRGRRWRVRSGRVRAAPARRSRAAPARRWLSAAVVPVAHERPPSVHLDPVERSAASGRAHLDRPRLVIDQPAPPERGGVAEHRARAGVQNRGREIRLHTRRAVADRVHPRKHLVEVTARHPPGDQPTVDSERAQLCLPTLPHCRSASSRTLALKVRMCHLHRHWPDMTQRIRPPM